MLTWHDFTVDNAAAIFEQCKDSQASYWGIKESPLSPAQMRQLFDRIKECGKKTVLEVVAYTEEEGLAGAVRAVECGCDILMGTKYFDSINDFCLDHGLKYMPFVGSIAGRPTVLSGDIDDIIAEAQSYVDKGVYGINLLGYRYTGDAAKLNRALIDKVNTPVCLAGSINSYRRLDEVKEAAPWAFTIGSAFFEKQFGDSMAEQIENVCRYLNK